MKVWFALAAAMSVLFAWLALRAPADDLLAGTVAAPPAKPPVLTPAVRVPAAEAPVPHGVRVHGVLLRGPPDGAASQALLSVEGGATQVFHMGEPVAQGWSLAAVAPDHVVLALGAARARLDVSYAARPALDAASAAVVQTAGAPRAAKSDVKEEPQPGFQPAAPGSRVGPPGPANLAANRKFMQDVQGRLAAGK